MYTKVTYYYNSVAWVSLVVYHATAPLTNWNKRILFKFHFACRRPHLHASLSQLHALNSLSTTPFKNTELMHLINLLTSNLFWTCVLSKKFLLPGMTCSTSSGTLGGCNTFSWPHPHRLWTRPPSPLIGWRNFFCPLWTWSCKPPPQQVGSLGVDSEPRFWGGEQR